MESSKVTLQIEVNSPQIHRLLSVLCNDFQELPLYAKIELLEAARNILVYAEANRLSSVRKN
jgi:hypothetical protein